MTLVTWVDDLEDLENLARYFRTRKPRINRLRASFMNAILNEQYARWRSWVDAYYGSSLSEYISLYFYFASPAYAPLILYGWLSNAVLEYRVKGMKNYQNGVKPLLGMLGYSKIELIDITNIHGLDALNVELELWIDSYLHIEEREFISLRGPIVLPMLLPQLLL